MPSVYRFSPALLVRSLGAFLALAGVVLVLVAALVLALGLPGVVLTVAVVLTVLSVVAVGFALSRLTSLVRFDETGYQLRLLRGAGVRRARWREVEDAVTTTAAGQDSVVLRLRDGRTTTIPVAVLDTDPDTFMRDLRERLDAGHGYRKLT